MINFINYKKVFLALVLPNLRFCLIQTCGLILKKLVELAADIDEKEHPKPAFLMVITAQNVALQDENGVYTVPLGCLKP